MMEFLALADALAIGALVVLLLNENRRPGFAEYVLGASLAAGLGIGITSLVFFGLRVVGIASPAAILFADALCIALGTAAAARAWKRQWLWTPPKTPKTWTWTWLMALQAGFGAILTAIACRLIQVSQANPTGEWDAWALWNLRAKFLAGPLDWRGAASPLLLPSHPDYPLMLSSFIARCWRLTGDTRFSVPAITGLLFFAALTGLLVAGLALLRGWTAGIMAGMLLFASRPLLNLAWAQYSDIPLAYFMLATLILLFLACQHDESLPHRSWSMILCAGFCAGLCAWTKQEGTFFSAAVVLAFPALEWIRLRRWLPAIRRAGVLWAGAAPGFLLAIWYRLFISPPSRFVQQPTGQILDKLQDLSRYTQTGIGVVDRLKAMGSGPGHPLILMAILALLLVRDGDKRYRTPVWVSGFALCAMLAAYFLAYVLTPADLEWEIRTTMHRLNAQVWPCVVFLFCRLLPSSVRPVSESLSHPEQPA